MPRTIQSFNDLEVCLEINSAKLGVIHSFIMCQCVSLYECVCVCECLCLYVRVSYSMMKTCLYQRGYLFRVMLWS